MRKQHLLLLSQRGVVRTTDSMCSVCLNLLTSRLSVPFFVARVGHPEELGMLNGATKAGRDMRVTGGHSWGTTPPDRSYVMHRESGPCSDGPWMVATTSVPSQCWILTGWCMPKLSTSKAETAKKKTAHSAQYIQKCPQMDAGHTTDRLNVGDVHMLVGLQSVGESGSATSPWVGLGCG